MKNWIWMIVIVTMVGCQRQPPPSHLSSLIPHPSSPLFTDIAARAGINFQHRNGATGEHFFIETFGGGCAFIDFDHDGWLDVFLLQSGELPKGSGLRAEGSEHHQPSTLNPQPLNALFRNKRDGTFADVTRGSGLESTGYGMGVAVGDFDNDGFDDIFITGYPRCRLFHNERGTGKFTEATARAGVAGDGRWSTSAAFVDYDRDGWLDLYVCHYAKWSFQTNKGCLNPRGKKSYCAPDLYDGDADSLYHNNGDGTFTDVTTKAGLSNIRRRGLGVAAFDYNDDGWVDLYVANDRQPNMLLRNNGNSTFNEVGTEAGASYSDIGTPLAGMGIGVGDYNNDGREDVFVTNFSGESNSLYRNDGEGIFTEVSASTGLATPSFPFLAFGCEFLDFDNDGWKDLIIGNGHTNDDVEQFVKNVTYKERKQLFRNAGDGTFNEVLQGSGDLNEARITRGLSVGDFDNDGDLDVLANHQNDAAQLLENNNSSGNHWIAFKLIGANGNRNGAHAKIIVRYGAKKQFSEVRSGSSYCAHSDRRVYFGLGRAESVDAVEVRWLDGQTERLTNVKANRIWVVTESKGMTGEIPGGAFHR
jgi:hypothetical protein